jgi:DNA polymerase-3 subunit gamma/tau
VAPSHTTPDPEVDAPVLPSARGPGGIDTAAIRRSWPDILAWIFRHKRATWTLLSEHATVHDYDGTRVQLAISTVGLANTFRSGTHAELVRQAMIDVLGVDARVEGTPANQREAGATSASGPPAPQGGSRWAAEQSGTKPSRTEEFANSGQVRARDDSARDDSSADDSARGGISRDDGAGGDATDRDGTTGAGSAIGESDDLEPSDAERSDAEPLVAQSSDAESSRAVSFYGEVPGTASADSAVSADDEDVEGLGEVGRSVIERLLGGQVIHEDPGVG